MATIYTIPNRPSGSDTRSISAILADFDAILAGMNSYDGGNIQDGTVLGSALVDAAKLGLSSASVVRRSKLAIATEEARTNVAYGTLTTPDTISNVVLPSDGFLIVAYQALWKNSVAGAGGAAIFLGANQLKKVGITVPVVSEASGPPGGTAYGHLLSDSLGLGGPSSGASDVSNVTTGQTMAQQGPFCVIFAAAGTYNVSVQFKATSGTVTAKDRKLWVATMGF